MITIEKNIPGLSPRSLAVFIKRAANALGLKGEVSVLATDNRRVRLLNRSFAGKDKPTDVLSFPADGTVSRQMAGDIAISVPIACANARRRGHAPSEEIKILALHGMLHLAGYDHETDAGEMTRKESQLRSQLGLSQGLIARAEGNKKRRTAKSARRTSRVSAKRKSRRQR